MSLQTNSTYQWLPLLGQVAGTLAARQAIPSTDMDRQKSMYARLAPTVGAVAGGTLADMLAGKSPTFDQLLSPRVLGDIGAALGTALGDQDTAKWTAPLGRLIGTGLSSIVQGRDVLADLARPQQLQNLLGQIGQGVGGKWGGIGGTIAGNVLSNVLKGGDVVSNLTSLGNLTGLGAGLLSFLLPKDMPAPAKSILGTGTGLLANALTGATLPTIGSAASSISSGLGTAISSFSPFLASIPVALPLSLLSMGLGIWGDLRAQQKQRKAQRRQSATLHYAKSDLTPQLEPLVSAIENIGQQRMKYIDEIYNTLKNKYADILTFNPNFITREAIMKKYGIPTNLGLTEEEQLALFAQPRQAGDYLTLEDFKKQGYTVGGSRGTRVAPAPWTFGAQQIMNLMMPDYGVSVPLNVENIDKLFQLTNLRLAGQDIPDYEETINQLAILGQPIGRLRDYRNELIAERERRAREEALAYTYGAA